MTHLSIQQQLIAAFHDADNSTHPKFVGLGFAKRFDKWRDLGYEPCA